MSTTFARALLFVACALAIGSSGCKRKDAAKERERQKADNAAAIARAKETMARVAALEPVVKSQPPAKSGGFRSSPLSFSGMGVRNFDVLFLDELAKVPRFPKYPGRRGASPTNCQAEIDNNYPNKYVGRTECDGLSHLVVLRARTVQRAQVTGASYTPGIVDADAFVFDVAAGKLLGSGRIFAKTPLNAVLKPSTAESELETMLGKAVDDALKAEFTL